MRVALVCPYDLGVPGGVQSQVRTIAAGLLRRGHEVLVVAPGTDPTALAIGEGVVTELVGTTVAIAANGSRAPLALHPGVLPRVRAALARFSPDVVHLHEPFAPLVGPATLLAAGAPIVGTFHRSGGGRGFRLLGLGLRPLAGRLSALTAVSSRAAATAQAFLGARSVITEVPNTIDPAPWRAARTTDERHNVVFVGRHEPRKGLAVLLEAAAGLPGGERLVVVGSGPQTSELVARYHHNEAIEFLGRRSDEEVHGLLGSSSLYVAPSLGGESFGLGLIEAMAAGAAVVASAIPGYEEAAGDAACFVPPGDAAALAAALTALIADSAARARLVAAGEARVERFSTDTVLPGYEALFEQVVQ